MFKKIKYIFSKTKVAFIGLLLILLPFIYLSYTNYISLTAKSDSEKNAFQITAELIADKIEQEISTREEKLTVIKQDLRSHTSERDTRQLLRRLEEQNPIIRDPAIIRKDGALVSGFLSKEWEKSGKSLLRVSDSLWLEFRNAEEAEFIRQDFKEAVKLYRNSLRKKNIPEDSILVLSRVGRCYFKMNDFRSGINTYEQIIGSGKYSYLLGGIPSVIAAKMQVYYGYEALQNSHNQCRSLIALYQELIENPWEPITGEYSAILNNTYEQLKICINKNTSCDNQDKINILEVMHKRIYQQYDLFSNRGNFILKNSNIEDNPGISHRSYQTGDTLVQTGYFRLHEEGKHLLYFLNKEYIFSKIVPLVLSKFNADNDIVIALLNDKNNIVVKNAELKGNSLLAGKNFRNIFVNYKIALYDKEGRSIRQLADTEKQQAMLLFGGTIFIVLLGVFIIVRSAVHELEISRMKSDFVSNVSHELKTPLSLISMFSETLESDLQIDNKQRRQFYSIINRETQRLTHLINNVLDFSRIDENKKEYNFRKTDISTLLLETIDPYKRRLNEKGFELQIDIPGEAITVSVDKEAIQRAFLNLLSNAEKYSGENKCVQIRLRKESGSAIITVADQGIGIPEKDQGKIFDKFYRSSNSQTIAASGTGLGLTITKYIIEKHNGKIEVKSEPGKGSIFTIVLPLSH